jgi:hypothetical protein
MNSSQAISCIASSLKLRGFSAACRRVAFSGLLLLLGCFSVTGSQALAQGNERKEVDSIVDDNFPAPDPDEISKHLKDLADDHSKRMKRMNERLDEDLKNWQDELSKRINEQFDRKYPKRSWQQFLVDLLLFCVVAIGLFCELIICIYLRNLLKHAVKNQISRIDNPAVVKRWRAFWLVASVVALAPLVYMIAAKPVWFDGPGALVGVGLFLFQMMFVLSTFEASKLCRQRRDDLLAEALFAKISSDADVDEPFVLYLRPFVSTGAFTHVVRFAKGRQLNYELEEELSHAVRPFGPLIALGESLEHLGAGRIKSTDANWRETVSRLMRKALLIVTVPSSRPGTLWEIEQLLAENWITKTVFIDAPNTSATPSFAQEMEWGEIGRLLASRGYEWPFDDPKGCLIFFGASKSPQLSEPLNFQGPGSLRAALKRVLALAA